ncbi:MAG: sugar phosphate isomerase/epimerase family protein [Promethearchaeota archaeon]
MIKLALNENSCKNLSIIEFIKFSRDFDGVELNFKEIKKVLSNNIKLKDILETLKIYNLEVYDIFRIKDFSLCSEREFKIHILGVLKQMFSFCHKLESNLIIINPSKFDNSFKSDIIPKWRVINRTKKRLEEISKKANKEDINIGFEFLSDSSISNLNDAKEVLEPFQSYENVGYIIDLFHIVKSESDYFQLQNIKDFIFLIQFSDIIHEKENSIDTSSALKTVKRIFPGEGYYELKSFIDFTQKIGYRKRYSLELSKDECLVNLYKKFNRKYIVN